MRQCAHLSSLNKGMSFGWGSSFWVIQSKHGVGTYLFSIRFSMIFRVFFFFLPLKIRRGRRRYGAIRRKGKKRTVPSVLDSWDLAKELEFNEFCCLHKKVDSNWKKLRSCPWRRSGNTWNLVLIFQITKNGILKVNLIRLNILMFSNPNMSHTSITIYINT